MGNQVADNLYHVGIIKNQLKRATPQLIPAVHDELVHAFQEYLQPPADGSWQSIHIQPILMKVICRASNRTFVGLPLCTLLLINFAFSRSSSAGRDPDFMELNMNYTVEVFVVGTVLRLFPSFMRP
jgi:hypothetical protein